MNTITANDLSRLFGKISIKADDTRAMLVAIETMLFDTSGRDNDRAAETANDIHCLVTIALERARQSVVLIDQFEPMLNALRGSAPDAPINTSNARPSKKRKQP
jgi:hypothetical protein